MQRNAINVEPVLNFRLKGKRNNVARAGATFEHILNSVLFPSFSPEVEELERSVSVKMIDFAHVWPAEVGQHSTKHFLLLLVTMPLMFSTFNAVLKKNCSTLSSSCSLHF